MEGLQKIESAVAGSEAEGPYGLLRGAISHSHVSSTLPTTKKCHHTPTATTSKLPPQESKEAAPEVSAPVVEEVKLALEAPSLAVLQALEVAIPTHTAPLHLQLGGVKRVYKCCVEECSEGPSTSHAAICAHVCGDHLGVRLACPSCAKTFLNSDALSHHRKLTVPSNFYIHPLFPHTVTKFVVFYVKGHFVCPFVHKSYRNTRQTVLVSILCL